MPMTRKERLTAIFEGRIPDRPAVKLWGLGKHDDRCVHPAFEPVRDLAFEKTDLALNQGAPFSLYAGREAETRLTSFDRPTDSPDWVEHVTTFHTPEGDLRQVSLKSTSGKPGYVKERPLKEPSDISRLLSIPYTPFPFDPEPYRTLEAQTGDAGIVMFGLDHAMYGVERLIGSENFALWSLEAEDVLLEAMQTFAGRIREHAAAALQAGIRGVFGWVGPELCIPPLMSPQAFDKYVFDIDKPLIDMIHDAGGRVWVHSHGKMTPVLERFVLMGIDVLNPIEPPPMGDVTMEEAFQLVGDRMGLEGNIETHDFMQASNEEIRAKIHDALEAGRGRRLILCPSSGYQENINPTPREIGNWLLYINEGVRYAESMCND